MTSIDQLLRQLRARTAQHSPHAMGVSGTLLAPWLKDFANAVIDPGQVTGATQVLIGAYTGKALNDRIILNYAGDRNSTFPYQMVHSDNLNVDIAFTIAKTPYIDDNSRVELSYLVQRADGGSETSEVLPVTIQAGEPWPAPTVVDATGRVVTTLNPIKPGTVKEENTAAVLVADARLLGSDLLAVVWTVPGAEPQAVFAVVSNGEARAAIPRGLLAVSIGTTVIIEYVVFRGNDVLGAWESLALPVLAIAVDALPRPTIAEAGAAGELDVSRLTADATATVAAWPFIDTSQVYWLEARGVLADGNATVIPLADSEPVSNLGGIARPISLNRLQGLRNGSRLELVMRVMLGANASDATTFPLGVFTLRTALEVRPDITDVRDSTGTVYKGGSTTETTLGLMGTSTAGQAVQILDNEAPLAIVDTDANGDWRYTAVALNVGSHAFKAKGVDGSQLVSEPWPLTVALPIPDLAWDTSSIVLSGKLYIMNTGLGPTSPPNGTSLQRLATGGVPPYRYQSSNPAIAAISDSGIIQAAGNGSTTLSVSDQSGQSKQLAITVSGVTTISYSGSGQWYPPGNAGHILSRETMAEIWVQCSQHGGAAALGIPGGVYWTGTTSNNLNRYYTRNLADGAEGTDLGQGIGSPAHYMLKLT